MESNKALLLLLPLIFSLFIIEKSMASRILPENNSPPPPDKDGSRIRVNGSVPDKDGSWNGDGSDQRMVLVPPPATKTTMSQAGQPNMSASAVVVAPTNAKVDVATAVSPTSATSKASVTSSSRTSSTSATSGGTVSKSSFTSVGQSSSATLTKHP
ncbi:uncharacterized protein DDB_G0290587-like isoform X2 [Rhodamnia argentea]|uniref:Uncharacterized protein DDB_G0290587-like isoform X2 n=1 Tax=Rhodamnia argentea TaxID=178133 RepID=A0ABM3HDX1_9MYRT|nr:uncharacterized protein DDB_G0290587-like isoform X2 [Rhodamnia argentea]